MTVAQSFLMGKTPGVKIGQIDPNKPRVDKTLTEKQKYQKMWTVDEYRKVSPGELAANTFFSVAKPDAGDTITDFGAGTGRGGLMLWAMGKLNVTMLDFADNCLDDDLVTATKKFPEQIRFMEHDLTKPTWMEVTRYGYCTDVMEHIPADDVDKVLHNILNAARSVFFRISTTPDVMGPRYLKQHLHLTVKDYAWWAKKFIEHGCTILHSEDLGEAVDFYVTGWTSKLPKNIKINTAESQILSNIKENSKFPCKHVRAHQIQDVDVQIICGGPSLSDFKDEIIENWKNGMKTITVNGTYNWAQENGITNVNQCMIDARPFNKRFCEPPRDDCYYFIASQCDPEVFEMLPHDRTFFWHATGSPEAVDVVSENYPEYIIAGGGSTVALRTICLMRVLGFKKMHIYGMDSCCVDGEHHAYSQPENDYKVKNIPVTVGGRTFDCQPWMVYQAQDLVDMVKTIGDEFMLDVKGDGLIAHILKTGADMPEIEDS